MRTLFALLMALCMTVGLGGLSLQTAHAEADGPDAWDVSGVRSDDVLNLHAEASARSKTIAGIPHDARGLKSLGCRGLPNFEQWSKMTAAERERSARARWCKVEFNGKTGWVAGRYLKESTAASPSDGIRRFGAWSVRCSPFCVLEQTGVGTSRRTMLRLEKRDGNNARITIERTGLPKTGTLSFHMDGEQISQGPIAPFRGKDGRSLVMEPDDITANLVKRMQAGKTLVISFPGEDRGVEIHLDRFMDGWRELGG